MAVTYKLVNFNTGEYEFKGLSTDDKPTECGENSLFLELDTGDTYYFSNDSWTKCGSVESSGVR